MRGEEWQLDVSGRVELRARLQRRRRIYSTLLRHWSQLVQLRRQHDQQHPAQRQVRVDGCYSRRQQDRLSTQQAGAWPRWAVAYTYTGTVRSGTARHDTALFYKHVALSHFTHRLMVHLNQQCTSRSRGQAPRSRDVTRSLVRICYTTGVIFQLQEGRTSCQRSGP